MTRHLETRGFNSKREVEDYINSKGIEKDSILSFFQELDGTYTLMYYAE